MKIIVKKTGDLLKSECQALVNPVNYEGVIGKGLILQFKTDYPNMSPYKLARQQGKLKTGSMHLYEENNKIIINFPTKDKWRNNSKLEYI